MQRSLFPTVFLMLVPMLSADAAETVGRATLDDYLGLAVVRDAEIAPTGTHVAWKEFRNDFEADRDDEQLWVASLTDGRRWPLTQGESSVGDYEWSPDGAWIVFTRDEQLFAIAPTGGEAMALALEGTKQAGDLRFAPDATALYFLAVAADDPSADARRERFGDYTVFREEGDYRHIWRLALTPDMRAEGAPQALTHGRDFSVTEFAPSPDGRQIAFAAWPTPHLSDLLKGRLYRVATQGGAVQPLVDAPGAERSLRWRSDGARLAFTASAGFPDYADLYTLAGDGTDLKHHDLPDHDPRIVDYSGATVLFEAGVRTTYGRFTFSTDTGAVTALDGTGYFASTSTARDGTRAFIGTPDGGLAEVHVESGAGTRTLTDYGEQLQHLFQPRQTLLRWTSFDGLEIEGVLTWPAAYREGQRYPLFVRTHGGPTGTDRPGLLNAPRSLYLPAVLAAHGSGAFVLQTNYRGSAAYGDAFQKTNLRQLGIGPARDILAGIRRLVDDGLVDAARVGCLGWSQGGHISAMLATYSDACAAAIMGAGISDWRTYYYNTDITQFTTEYLRATPLEDDEVYALTSPVTYIDRARTPVLIQHGEKVARVPIANGYQLRQLLLDRGVTARMVVYAGMGHGPRTPRHRRAITAHALAWFDEYLFGGEPAELL